jgi:hypothetical protein
MNGTCQNGIYVQMVQEPAGTDGVQTYALIYFRFFSDAALTIPISVTNLTVNYVSKRYSCGVLDDDVFYESKVCNGTTAPLGKPIVSMRDGGVCYDVFYYLMPGAGYIADPLSMEP